MCWSTLEKFLRYVERLPWEYMWHCTRKVLLVCVFTGGGGIVKVQWHNGPDLADSHFPYMIEFNGELPLKDFESLTLRIPLTIGNNLIFQREWTCITHGLLCNAEWCVWIFEKCFSIFLGTWCLMSFIHNAKANFD